MLAGLGGLGGIALDYGHLLTLQLQVDVAACGKSCYLLAEAFGRAEIPGAPIRERGENTAFDLAKFQAMDVAGTLAVDRGHWLALAKGFHHLAGLGGLGGIALSISRSLPVPWRGSPG